MQRSTIACAALAALLSSVAAVAQDAPTEIARRDFIQQAQQAATAGDHPRALDLASRAGRIRMTTTLRMMIAQEHNALGHTLDALDFAVRCAHEAEANQGLADRERVLEACRALETSLRARVGRVTVRVPEPTPSGLRVRIQGSEVDSALWGVPYPVVPGSIVVEAVAGDGAAFRSELSVEGGATAEVSVVLTPGVRLGPDTGGARRGRGAGPWILAGAGAVILGSSALFLVLRDGAVSDRDGAAESTRVACDASAASCDYSSSRASDDQARTYNLLTNVALGVGAAALAGGVLWFVLARPSAESPTRTALRWDVMPVRGGAMLGVGGSL